MILNSVSVDCVIFGFDHSGLRVLLNQINREALIKTLPEQASSDQIKKLYEQHPLLTSDQLWSLFGGHVPEECDLEDFAQELLYKATGLKNVFLQQIQAFGSLDRVPYTRVITIGFYALINPDYYKLKQSSIAKSLQWFNINELPQLCFDHEKIIRQALNKLQQEVRYHPVGFHLLAEKFTLTEIQSLYEVILNKKMDTRNFRKKLTKMKLLVDSGEKQKNVAHRAAKLYKFDIKVYEKLKEEGLNFRIE